MSVKPNPLDSHTICNTLPLPDVRVMLTNVVLVRENVVFCLRLSVILMRGEEESVVFKKVVEVDVNDPTPTFNTLDECLTPSLDEMDIEFNSTPPVDVI